MSKGIKIVVEKVAQGGNCVAFTAELAGYRTNKTLAVGSGASEEEAIGDLFIKNRKHPVVFSIFSIEIELPEKREIPKSKGVSDPDARFRPGTPEYYADREPGK